MGLSSRVHGPAAAFESPAAPPIILAYMVAPLAKPRSDPHQQVVCWGGRIYTVECFVNL